MGQNFDFADIPSGHENPLSFALASRDSTVMDMVNRAVAHDQVMLAYQMVVPAADPSKPAFYEGLARIMDETGRIIPANNFIDTIEATETGRVIDCLTLEKGIQMLSEHPGLRLSINMSARSIGYYRWTQTLQKGLNSDPTVAERLILEITESSAMVIPELVVSFMSEVQKTGITFALDDFGAGYTSFRYLKNFYFDILKIDGQFIRNIANDSDNQILTAALASIAEQFDMLTVAECAENPEDVRFLTDLGIDCLQGFYFGAPTVHPPWLDHENAQASA